MVFLLFPEVSDAGKAGFLLPEVADSGGVVLNTERQVLGFAVSYIALMICTGMYIQNG
ncbi:hypothetical protein SDC9_176922 [bioreactor metagenome]|uniref:Uncharacterized protein n=1 Tax=bioreactor metagenome TaxID=1076179 RepID=A0A645GUN4_9ZZZZ